MYGQRIYVKRNVFKSEGCGESGGCGGSPVEAQNSHLDFDEDCGRFSLRNLRGGGGEGVKFGGAENAGFLGKLFWDNSLKESRGLGDGDLELGGYGRGLE